MTMPRGAFDADSYRGSFGDQLSALAGAQNVEQQDPLSDPSGGGAFDPNQEQAVQRQNVSSQNTAPLPSPMQMSRQIGRLRPPQGAKVDGGALSPQSSSAFHDTQQSAPVYDYTDNAPEADVKAHIQSHTDAISAGKDQHGHPDMESVWQSTFQDQLQQRSKQATLDQERAKQLTNVTWRDKAAMFLDAANRATIIQSQNPMMSQGAAWAAATRGALDGYQAHVQGAHDAYLQNAQAQRAQAAQAADAAVKRSGDTYGLWAKGEQLRMTQEQRDETARHNKAMEGIDQTKADTEKKKATNEKEVKPERYTAEADGTDDYDKPYKKGDLLSVDKNNKVTRVGKGGTVARKPGTDKDAAGTEISAKDAETARDKSDAEWEKNQGGLAKAVGYKNPDGSKMTPDQVASAKKQFLKTRNPAAYKTLYPDETGGSSDTAGASASGSSNPYASMVGKKK